MKRMLIDASHREETRVVVLDGSKVEEFDFEAASKRPLKGNIYLAKVTRVEPSLQAAFVEYGGNRQGFLAFNEIHPDYYQIPIADRQALLEDQQREARRRAAEEGFESVETGTAVLSDEELEAEDAAEAANAEHESGDDENSETDTRNEGSEDEDYFDNRRGRSDDDDDDHPIAESEVESGFDAEQADLAVEHNDDDDRPHRHDPESSDDNNPLGHVAEEEVEEGIVDQQTVSEAGDAPHAEPHGEEHQHPYPTEAAHIPDPETEAEEGIVDEQAAAEAFAGNAQAEGSENQGDQPAQPLQSTRASQRFLRRRHYKIQEVVKRRQVMLVQVVKEERGNKGAALTTYLSLAGRYCVLMPNTPRGGGISRKITNPADRKRLKSAAAALELPEGMGLIIRTAGEARTKLEIKRDYEYLLRLWDQIRELTLESNAPACVYEEGDLIKRAIRDLYNKDVEEIVVEGDEGYKNAKDFMRMLMPSHAKNVKPYKEATPLFQSMHIEAQLDAMFQPTVTLKSGGYIVINQTEALVAIDVNSGRATKEHSIEETAHKTNLEAATEIGRQLRLRDLAGLIVIDFIDMEDGRNDRHVEKRLRDAVKNDRARVQIGKISQFGLLEMSRQRLRAGVVAGSTVTCPHCGGQGIVRSVESTALRVLRGIEEEGQRGKSAAISVKITPDVAMFMLNKKRQEIARIESEYEMSVSFDPDSEIMTGAFEISRVKQRSAEDRPHKHSVSIEAGLATPTDISEDIEEEIVEEDEVEDEPEEQDDDAVASKASDEESPQNGDDSQRRRRRRRGGRGRNRNRGREERPTEMQEAISGAPATEGDFEAEPAEATGDHPDGGAEAQQGESQRRRRRRRRGRRGRRDGEGQQQNYSNDLEGVPVDASVRDTDVIVPDETHEPLAAKPNAESAPVWSLGSEQSRPAQGSSASGSSAESSPSEPPKKGWWQRAFSSKT